MVLLAGAALFVRGLHELNNRRHGWESDHLVTGTLLLPTATYPGDKEITDFQRLALERLEALPGVASASISYSMPFFGLAEPRKYLVAGRETPAARPRARRRHQRRQSPLFRDRRHARCSSGRTFNDGDTLTSPKVFIINQAMARGLFGGESPLGRRIAQAGGKTVEWGEIVGVVGRRRNRSTRIASPVTYQLYQPMAQEPRPLQRDRRAHRRRRAVRRSSTASAPR